MSSGVVPLGKIVYVCDDVLQDPASGKVHVLGVFNAIRPPSGTGYPYHLPKLCVFAQLTGSIGVGTVQARAMDASTGQEVFASPQYQVNFPGGQSILTVVIRLSDCLFPQPGVYLVQLFSQGAFIDDRRLVAQ
jgi:hypothetical protein